MESPFKVKNMREKIQENDDKNVGVNTKCKKYTSFKVNK